MTLLGVIITCGLWLLVRLYEESEARKMCTPRCACADSAVEYDGWEGTVHTFNFASRHYHALFALANRRSLVNIDPAAVAQMEASYGAYENVPTITSAVSSAPQLESPIVAPASSVSSASFQLPPPPPPPPPPDQPLPQLPATRTPRASAPPSPSAAHDAYLAVIGDIETAKGPSTRRAAYERGRAILPPEMHDRLAVEATRIEVRAVLDKIDTLKTPSSKRRHLLEALEMIRTGDIPDGARVQGVAALESALNDLGQSSPPAE